MTKGIDRLDVINKVFARLKERSELLRMARQVYAGICDAQPPNTVCDQFFGEKDAGTLCNPAGSKGADGRFECAKNDFSCSSYDCGKEFTFSDCGGSANSFACNTGYQCKGAGGNENFFDCHDFSCDGKGVGNYHCEAKFDFLCGDEFECATFFNCKGGHIFACTDDHDCNDNFGCSGGGTKCSTAFPYSRPDDTTPGDFFCGIAGGDSDSFDCTDSFNCTAQDQFECWDSATFRCGGGEGDKFGCGDQTDFDCDTSFNCQTFFECLNVFDCATAAKFSCKSPTPFSPPPSD